MYDPTNSRYRYLSLQSKSGFRKYSQKGNILENGSLEFNKNIIPAHGTYGALLFRLEWRAKRQQILIRDFRCCVICKSDESLQVHHRQYHFVVQESQFKLPWEYAENLLITLCESCHKRGHNKFKVPTINI